MPPYSGRHPGDRQRLRRERRFAGGGHPRHCGRGALRRLEAYRQVRPTASPNGPNDVPPGSRSVRRGGQLAGMLAIRPLTRLKCISMRRAIPPARSLPPVSPARFRRRSRARALRPRVSSRHYESRYRGGAPRLAAEAPLYPAAPRARDRTVCLPRGFRARLGGRLPLRGSRQRGRLDAALAEIGTPAVLDARFGYYGKGQSRIMPAEAGLPGRPFPRAPVGARRLLRSMRILDLLCRTDRGGGVL